MNPLLNFTQLWKQQHASNTLCHHQLPLEKIWNLIPWTTGNDRWTATFFHNPLIFHLLLFLQYLKRLKYNHEVIITLFRRRGREVTRRVYYLLIRGSARKTVKTCVLLDHEWTKKQRLKTWRRAKTERWVSEIEKREVTESQTRTIWSEEKENLKV